MIKRRSERENMEESIITECKALVIRKVKNKRVAVSQNEKEAVYDEFDCLTKLVLDNCQSGNFALLALQLFEYQFVLLRKTQPFVGKIKLERLVHLCELAKKVADTLKQKKKGELFRKKYSVLEEIQDEMENVGDIEEISREKCNLVAWGLFSFSEICNKMEDFTKSLEIAKHAIGLVKTVYGVKANQLRILALCYRNACFSYCNDTVKERAKAEQWKKKALEASEKANWDSDEQKSEFVKEMDIVFNQSFRRSNPVKQEK